MPSGDRDALERLLRYILRPAVAAERISLRADGRVVMAFRKPDPSGRTSWVTDGPELLRRLAALIPPVIIEAVSVGILIKRERTIIEMRPKKRWLDLSFITTATIASERIARSIDLATGTAYFVHLEDESDVDAELRRWLTASLRGAR